MGLDNENDEENDDDDDDISLPVLPPVRRQTFVFSATLTLPDRPSSRGDDSTTTSTTGQRKKRKLEPHSNDGKHHNKKKNQALSNIHGAIADLLQKAHAVGRTKVIDLTNGTDMGNSNSSNTGSNGKIDSSKIGITNKPNPSSTKSEQPTVATKEFQFPPGLQFQQILCTQRHKDSHLYGYILYFMSTLQQQQKQKSHQSSILIFCNSIAGVRRVGMTLTTLRLPVRMLHANMQQVRANSIYASCFNFPYMFNHWCMLMFAMRKIQINPKQNKRILSCQNGETFSLVRTFFP
jgi:ATP-dependent RNA helicase DDX24/MAK5